MNSYVPRVAMIEPVGGHGGNEFYDFGLCEHLKHEGIDVHLYTTDETRLDEFHKFTFVVKKYFKGIYGTDLKLLRGIRYLKGSLRAGLDAKRNGLTVAHFHIYHFSLRELANIIISRLFGLKCLSTIHDVHCFERHGTSNENRVGLVNRIIIALCQRLMVHSQLAFDSLVEIGVAKEQIRLVPHGDTDFLYGKSRVSKENALEKIGQPAIAGRLLLLFFGQIKKVKGLDVLLAALPYIDKNVQLLVVGKCWKQELSDYQKQIDALGVTDRVVFINEYIPNELVPYFFWASDIVCLPYRKIYSSGVVLRAMDYESTIVASDLSPLQAVIKNDETGALFETENPIDLAAKVNRLVSEPTLRAQMASNAKKFVDENYAWPVVAKATKMVYEEVL